MSTSTTMQMSNTLETTELIEVAIVIVAWQGADDLPRCLDSLAQAATGGRGIAVVVVDNGSTDDSADIARRHPLEVRVVSASANLGFCGGNNLGWETVQAEYPAVRYVILLNQDTFVAADWLPPLMEAFERDERVGAAQAKLLLATPGDTLNSIGNRSHYLGFGFTQAYGEQDDGTFDMPAEIDFPSGACVAVRADLIRRWGLFEPEMFCYLEDADLGWKLRQAGERVVYVPASRVWHDYTWRSNLGHYEHLERNRWWLLLVYYRWRTLLLLLPALLVMEGGQWCFAARHGRLGAKLRACLFFLRPSIWRRLASLRRAATARRRLTDREFMGGFSGRIETPVMNDPLLRWIGNPCLDSYWQFARRLIRW